ncbi:MAG: hypothetical protein K4H23_03180 [Mollicutes bacterium PWAP]|nr:hypothetical protein [Mollicutes bacterium PWAP]
MDNLEEREKIIILFENYHNFLTQTQKQAIHLHLIEDISYREIADIMATSRQASYDAVQKGIAKLKKIFNNMN